uniref:Transposase n=1 Tax=Strongyloides venezuelensis TaxID=75913 RepID=A0A0K0FJR5_STRVS
MFRILKKLIPNMALEKILPDFKKTTKNAARHAFQDADIRGSSKKRFTFFQESGITLTLYKKNFPRLLIVAKNSITHLIRPFIVVIRVPGSF